MKTPMILGTVAVGLVTLLPFASAIPNIQADGEQAQPSRHEQSSALPGDDPVVIQHREPVGMIVTEVEFIKVDTMTASKLLGKPLDGDNTELRKELDKMITDEKAELLESALVRARPGQRATVESIREVIYPTEWEAPGENPRNEEGDTNVTIVEGQTPSPASYPLPAAFETRNVGATLEVEPNIGADSSIIDLRFAPELVWHVENSPQQAAIIDGKSVVTAHMPIFYTIRTSTGTVLADGRHQLVASVSPKDDKGQRDPEHKVLIFVRASVSWVAPGGGRAPAGGV